MDLKRWKYSLWTITALGASVILILCSLSSYNRAHNDDFFYLATNSPTSHDNFNWQSNGRLSSLTSYYLLFPISYIVQIGPIITILLLVASYGIFISGILKLVRIKNELFVPILASLSVSLSLATIFLLPSVYAALFWLIALPPHAWSFCLVLVCVGLLLHRLQSKKSWHWSQDILAFLVLPLITGAFYEASALLLLTASLGLLSWSYYKKLQDAYRPLLFSVAGSIASLIALLFSPGALRRQQLATDAYNTGMTDRLLHLPQVLFDNYFVILPQYLKNPEILIIIAATGILVGAYASISSLTSKQATTRLALIAACTLLFTAADMAVVWLGLQEHQTVREYLSLTIGMTLGTFFAAVTIGQFVRSRYKQILPAFGIGIASVSALIILVNLAYLPQLKDFRSGMVTTAAIWDDRDRKVKKAVERGVCNIPAEEIAISGLWHMRPEKNYWVNSAVSYYYETSKNGKLCQVYASKIHRPNFGDNIFENPKDVGE